MCQPLKNTEPGALVVVAKAAHAIGDRDLELAAKKLLDDQHGIKITFRRETTSGRVPT